jgi:hypothetical protein
LARTAPGIGDPAGAAGAAPGGCSISGAVSAPLALRLSDVETAFPRGRQIIDEILKNCTKEEKAKIAGGNAARIYHLN